ncbi:unnamed protein product [Onchocerca flexuosa]|uniref:DNA replication ATP-dependent helicase/nuclease n=1 Tax=Onchocerca flexuosa TaxID=387005 RepID=A0A183H0M5_9BILA|nr:unnamed protein product [Onchocerca flexuosa]
MEWPKFDFAKCSHSQRHRLSSVGKSSCGLKKNRSKVFRSLTVDFENIKSRKKENLTEGNTVQNESIITLHQQMSPNRNPLICAQGNSFQMNRKVNAERVPPLSPILVNGFLKDSIAHLPKALKNSNLDAAEILTSRCTDSINPILYCEDPIILESPGLIFTPSDSKQLLLSSESLTFSLQRSKVVPRNKNFASQSENSTFFVTVAEESDNLNSNYKKSGKKASYRLKLHASSSIATPTSTQSLNSSLTSLETLPPSQIEYKSLNRTDTSPNLNFESDKSITMQHKRSDGDVSQNHTVYVDDSESVADTDEQSRDCFFDITINEIESNDSIFETKETNDSAFETKLFVQSKSSPAGNQSKIYDFYDEIDEASHQKQYHRLSKLAETLKKRLLISSSDLAMWKCEKPKQHQARRVTVISSAEQWGFCWTLVKNVNDSRTAHIVDSEPMKKTMDVVCRNRSLKEKNAGDGQEGRDCHDSLQQTSEKTFILYQPLSKLNTSLGEFILSPRYYR